MKHDDKLSITMPTLTPEMACALSDWLFTLTHEVNLHYADHIRTHIQSGDQFEEELEGETKPSYEVINEYQEEVPF